MASRPLALKSNGKGEELNDQQIQSIEKVKRQLLDKCLENWKKDGCDVEMEDYCGDPDTIRRFLVARKWNETDALNQLLTMQAWRVADKPWIKPFYQSPACITNPFALCMRCVGLDDSKRPVLYTVFSQANERYDVEKNVAHMRMLLNAVETVVIRLRRDRITVNADQMQCIWIIDFHGFGIWDQNPNSALETGRLMAHFPELLNWCVLVGAPWVFNATWNLVSLALDDRVRAKVSFVASDKLLTTVSPRLGERMTKWLAKEVAEVREKNPTGNLRKYWKKPQDPTLHDPRGEAEYCNSPFYIRTPGDAWEEKQ